MAKKRNEEQVPRIRDQNFASIYTNAIGVIQSTFDIQLLFSHVQLQPTEKGGKLIVDRGIVSMSPHQAKALAELLSETLKQWEASFGEIKIPPQARIAGQ